MTATGQLPVPVPGARRRHSREVPGHPQLRPYVPTRAAVRSCRSRLRTVADAPVAARRRRCDAARQSGAGYSRRRTPIQVPAMGVHTCGSQVSDRPPGKPAAGTVPRPAGGTLLGRPRQRRPPHRPPRRPKAQQSSICPSPDADIRTSTKGASRADVPHLAATDLGQAGRARVGDDARRHLGSSSSNGQPRGVAR